MSQLSVEIIRNEREWDRLAGSWQQLFTASPTASPPLRFEWLREWWGVYGDAYGERRRGLRVVIVRRGGRLVGALPLYESRDGGRFSRMRRLRFISTGEAEYEETCPDYMDLLHLPGEGEAAAAEIRAALLEDRGGWDELELRELGEQSPLLAWAREPAAGARLRVVQSGVSPQADISGGLDAYLGRLSANGRQQARRLLREAARAGATLRLAGNEPDAMRFFDEMIELHQVRWRGAAKPGCFGAPRFTEMHRALCRLWVPSGKAVVARLAVDDRPLAVLYGFLVGAKFDFYQSGVAIGESQGLRSPGIVAFLVLMERLAGLGVTTFDFLKGESVYKQRLATKQVALVRLHMVRPSLRRGLYCARGLLRRCVAKGRAILRGRLRPKRQVLPEGCTGGIAHEPA